MKAEYSPTGRHSNRCKWCKMKKQHTKEQHNFSMLLTAELRRDEKRILSGARIPYSIVIYSIR